MSFVPLYLSTEYSLLASTCRIRDLAQELTKYHYTSCAMVGKSTLYGAIPFYQTCRKNQIQPIFGLEILVSVGSYSFPLLCYAKNNIGYRNLMRISSTLQIHEMSSIPLEKLQSNSLGILFVLPFSNNYFTTLYRQKKDSIIAMLWQRLISLFDEGYLGLVKYQDDSDSFFDALVESLKQGGYPLVALPPIRYYEASQYRAYESLLAIANNFTVPKLSPCEKEMYLFSEEELRVRYHNHLDLLEQTEVIASHCQVKIDFQSYQIPEYSSTIPAREYLASLCQKGLEKRLQVSQSRPLEVYQKRLYQELKTIDEMGFSDYFLIVWDYVKYAKTHNIGVGPGRGSVGASLVAYCLGITEVDPLKYHLLFERFLNKERITMPDIDVDFEDEKREEVIHYVWEKYGAMRVAHLTTFGTYQPKIALNDCAKVFHLSDIRLKECIKALEKAGYIKDKEYQPLTKIIQESEEIKKMMEDYEDIAEVLKVASVLQDLPRTISTHPAGVMITKESLVLYTPLAKGVNDIYQTQYTAHDLEDLGLLKMDFLALKNITNIKHTIELIKQDEPNFSFPLEENDSETYQMLQRGEVKGLFQIEQTGLKKLVMEMKTSNLADLTAAIALFRPGPMEIIPTYLKRKFKEEVVTYPHPDLERILKETYGTIVYQEQIMLIAWKFAGYSLGKADVLRRAVAKKKRDILENERLPFVHACVQKGYSQKIAEDIYSTIVKFASYGFNKAHSVAYAKIVYQTAYLKCHYFPYYLASLMSYSMGSSQELLAYLHEANARQIRLIAPRINKSQEFFLAKPQALLAPLTMVKSLGLSRVKQILEEREKHPFDSFDDFITRTKDFLSRQLIENMIYAGCFDEFGLTKKAMIENYESIQSRAEYGFVENLTKTTYTEEEYSYGELLAKEKEMLGINLRYNFFHQYEDFYKRYGMIKLSALPLEKNIKTMGRLIDLREIKTKKNELMAFGKIEDDTFEMEITLFPKVYEQAMPLSLNQIMIIFGHVQTRENKKQILVEQVNKI